MPGCCLATRPAQPSTHLQHRPVGPSAWPWSTWPRKAGPPARGQPGPPDLPSSLAAFPQSSLPSTPLHHPASTFTPGPQAPIPLVSKYLKSSWNYAFNILTKNKTSIAMMAPQMFRIFSWDTQTEIRFCTPTRSLSFSHSLPRILLIVHLNENNLSLNQRSKIPWTSNNSLPTTSKLIWVVKVTGHRAAVASLLSGHLDKRQKDFR